MTNASVGKLVLKDSAKASAVATCPFQDLGQSHSASALSACGGTLGTRCWGAWVLQNAESPTLCQPQQPAEARHGHRCPG